MKPIGIIIIGDEIMRGKRRDGHFAKAVEILTERGLRLSWAQYLGDERPRLVAGLQRSFASGDLVFSFGGIGVTPDDHTRQAAAAALGAPLALHPDAEREIRARMAEVKWEVTPNRLQLGEFPVGSRIIPNPYNRIPGFSCADHHFLPGFPQMAWPMMAWVLDTWYPELFHRSDEIERAIIVWEGHEGMLVDLMRRLEAGIPGLTVFSLPSFGTAEKRRHLELGARGRPGDVDRALAEMRAEVARLGLVCEDVPAA